MSLEYCAGLLEGEGCFSLHKRSNRKNTISLAIHCEMSDEEPIYFLHQTFGVGNVCFRKNKRSDGRSRKPTWIWSVQKKKDILFVLTKILPFIVSKRRKDKINLLLSNLNENITNRSISC